ncbi:LOW QUALITY PROTEIN: hypothetical protein TorRG33x02_183870 [Trema orientale]|uniref:Transmembrane protein n=1 Tax=Trema orientale TaxID=63057 RepID=A0A2P5EJP8_TREOI|nr:LOW QUALITY PROTEIN: hypothetical protein TorRG33x02_183870 [Trema orientale]
MKDLGGGVCNLDRYGPVVWPTRKKPWINQGILLALFVVTGKVNTKCKEVHAKTNSSPSRLFILCPLLLTVSPSVFDFFLFSVFTFSQFLRLSLSCLFHSFHSNDKPIGMSACFNNSSFSIKIVL